jgi:hypothetical protein
MHSDMLKPMELLQNLLILMLQDRENAKQIQELSKYQVIKMSEVPQDCKLPLLNNLHQLPLMPVDGLHTNQESSQTVEPH